MKILRRIGFYAIAVAFIVANLINNCAVRGSCERYGFPFPYSVLKFGSEGFSRKQFETAGLLGDVVIAGAILFLYWRWMARAEARAAAG
jgi:hypothetical protein